MAELDQLAKTADKLGVGAQELEQLRYAAERAGLSAADLDKGMEKMMRGLSEAAHGSGTAKLALDSLGLSARQLAVMSPEKQMRTLADSIKHIKNPAERARVAYQIFGRQGTSMLNMLKDGSKGLDEQAAKFDDLNGAMSRGDLAKVEEANDAIADIGVAIKGAWREFTIQIAPALTVLAQFITLLVKAAKFLFQFTLLGMLLQGLRKMQHHTDDIQDARADMTPLLEDQLSKEKEIADKQKQQAADLKRQGETIRKEFLTPQEKFQAKMADLKNLVDAGAISWETYNRAVGGAVKDLKEANKQTTKLARPKAIGIVTRGSGASFSAQQASQRAAEHQRKVNQQQLREQERTNTILRNIDSKTKPAEFGLVNI